MIAPLPSSEIKESPYMFVAKTFAKTLAPHCRLYGEDRRAVTMIVHVVAVDADMSQCARSVEYEDPSPYLIVTV
jgi:hypothetical protein